MKQNNQKIDLTQLDSETLDQLALAIKGTKQYKRIKTFNLVVLFVVLMILIPLILF